MQGLFDFLNKNKESFASLRALIPLNDVALSSYCLTRAFFRYTISHFVVQYCSSKHLAIPPWDSLSTLLCDLYAGAAHPRRHDFAAAHWRSQRRHPLLAPRFASDLDGGAGVGRCLGLGGDFVASFTEPTPSQQPQQHIALKALPPQPEECQEADEVQPVREHR